MSVRNSKTHQYPQNRRSISSTGTHFRRGIHQTIADFILASLWVCSNPISELLVYRMLGLGHNGIAQFIVCLIRVMNALFFAELESISGGGSYSALAVLSRAISADFDRFLFAVGARIPAQVLGSIVGVKLLTTAFSGAGGGPRLNVEPHRGALIEGALAFSLVTISMAVERSLPHSFFTKKWMYCISKVTLHTLAGDLTGASMNPAAATGWAYARGDYMRKECLFVYWLAPVEATLLAVWVFKLLFPKQHNDKVM